MITIIPTSDYVILKRLETAPVTEGGLHVPETARKSRWQAEVVAVGPGKLTKSGTARVAPEVRVGDQVLITEFAGREFSLDYEQYACVRESEIVAVVG